MCYLKPPHGYLIYMHINDYLLVMPPSRPDGDDVNDSDDNVAVDASVALNFYY